MSTSSYHLQHTSRSRPTPAPLVFNDQPSTSRRFSSTQNASSGLLYDMPSSSKSPPISPSALNSPTSPTVTSRRSRNALQTPPPRNRSATPQGVPRSDLEKFAELCREWYFHQDEHSGSAMTKTLNNVPASQRAPYSRLQASVRSAYHADVRARKDAEFRAHLAATAYGGSLAAHTRANPFGSEAKKERHERFAKFVCKWCTQSMPGTKPFFEALWAIMRLQILPRSIGGAGSRRLKWELDDAVFKEAAGKEFMLEAIDVLKGMLGFEEIPSPNDPFIITPPSATYASSPSQHHVGTPPHSHRSSKSYGPSAVSNNPIASTIHVKRPRASSDPFLDAPPMSRSMASAASQSSSGTSNADRTLNEEPPSPATLVNDADAQFSFATVPESEEQFMRVWIAPDLTNPEFKNLLKVFPSFIAGTVPRFPSQSSVPDMDIESCEVEPLSIRYGTGNIQLGPTERRGGWEGGWWSRFCSWLINLFS